MPPAHYAFFPFKERDLFSTKKKEEEEDMKLSSELHMCGFDFNAINQPT